MDTEETEVSNSEIVQALKLRKLTLLRERLKLTKEYGLAFYKPFPKQDEFHRAGEFKRRMVRAGNRFGKSTLGCAEDCSWLLGERPWYPESDPARRAGIPQRPVKLLVITTDWDKVDEIWTTQRGDKPGKLWTMLPRGFVKSTRRNHSGAIDMVETRRGSMLRFDTVKSYQSNPLGSESSDWDAIHVDEPCPEDMWKAASRGLMDTNGSAWFTLTPLSEFWINDMFFPRDERNSEQERTEIISGARKQIWAIQGDTNDNHHLTKEAIDTYISTLSADEVQCRIKGIPLHLSGLIYKNFKFDKHVLKELPSGWKDFVSPPKGFTLYYAIDPHPQTPHAVLFCWVSPFGQKFFCDEIFQHCSIGSLSERIKGISKEYFVCRAKCDPLAYINDPITESNMADEFAAHGIYVEKATKALAQGILHAEQELAKENNIFIAPSMRRFLYEINHYVWDEKENKPLDKDDHMMENFYRILLDDPKYIDPNKSSENNTTEVEINNPDLDLDLVSIEDGD